LFVREAVRGSMGKAYLFGSVGKAYLGGFAFKVRKAKLKSLTLLYSIGRVGAE